MPIPITLLVTPVAAQAPAPTEPAGPVVVTAEALNPRFGAKRVSEQQLMLEEMLNEKLVPELITREGRPVAFTVPAGCDSVDIFYGAIEVNPGVGEDADLDAIVAVGDAVVTVSDGAVDALDALKPGSTIFVTVPWRAATWVELPANRLRVPVVAAFTRRNKS